VDRPAEIVRSGTNLWFAGGVAFGLRSVATEHVALLNDDAEPAPDWLALLVSALDTDPGLASVQGKVLLAGPEQLVNSAGAELLPGGWARDVGFGSPDDGRHDEDREVFHVSAAAAVYRTSAVRAVGGMDPRFFLYYEDVDLGWRLRLGGWSACYVAAARATHLHSATAGSGSALHAFHDDRNRLLCLVKNAPGSVALAEVVRHPLTTLSLTVRRRQVPWQRLRAFASLLTLLPHALRERGRYDARSRRAAWRTAATLRQDRG
jgi:GT2 family glycosyltransferase